MATIQRLAHSCLLVTTDEGTTLLDPDVFSYEQPPVDLDGLGDVQRVLITHEHADHVHPAFVAWLVDRGDDVTVHGNQAVVDLLADEGIDAETSVPAGTSVEDVDHEVLPDGTTVPNRSWTLGDVFTHPGDSYQPERSAPVLALPLLTPWGSATASVAFAKRLGVSVAVPVHDFYLTGQGRGFVARIVQQPLADAGIELLALDWGESATL